MFDEERHSSLCHIIRERRVIATLLNDFIVKLPGLINSRTGKIHCNFNQLGKEDKGVVTGRFSSSDPNLQQIPSHNYEVRLLFCGDTTYEDVEENNNVFTFNNICEVNTKYGWKYAVDLQIGDLLVDNDNEILKIINITRDGSSVIVYVE